MLEVGFVVAARASAARRAAGRCGCGASAIERVALRAKERRQPLHLAIAERFGQAARAARSGSRAHSRRPTAPACGRPGPTTGRPASAPRSTACRCRWMPCGTRMPWHGRRNAGFANTSAGGSRPCAQQLSAGRRDRARIRLSSRVRCTSAASSRVHSVGEMSSGTCRAPTAGRRRADRRRRCR